MYESHLPFLSHNTTKRPMLIIAYRYFVKRNNAQNDTDQNSEKKHMKIDICFESC